MALIEEMVESGQWLFRWRSYLPLLALGLVLVGIRDFAYPFGSQAWDEAWDLVCLGISFLGLAIRVGTVGFAAPQTSGRNTKRQVAGTLNKTGMYSVVRNPLYLGNFLVGAGPTLVLRVWWIPVIYTLVFMLYYERIIFAEESFLRQQFAQEYLEWAARTPAFWPRFRQWRQPALGFNWRKVLRQEHQTQLGVTVVFYLVDALTDWHVGDPPFRDWMWNSILILSLVVFTVVRTLYKLTDVLKDTPVP